MAIDLTGFNDEDTARLASPGWKRLQKTMQEGDFSHVAQVLLFPDSHTKKKLYKKTNISNNH